MAQDLNQLNNLFRSYAEELGVCFGEALRAKTCRSQNELRQLENTLQQQIDLLIGIEGFDEFQAKVQTLFDALDLDPANPGFEKLENLNQTISDALINIVSNQQNISSNQIFADNLQGAINTLQNVLTLTVVDFNNQIEILNASISAINVKIDETNSSLDLETTRALEQEDLLNQKTDTVSAQTVSMSQEILSAENIMNGKLSEELLCNIIEIAEMGLADVMANIKNVVADEMIQSCSGNNPLLNIQSLNLHLRTKPPKFDK